MKIYSKSKKQAGFTLAEMMITILILLMVTAVVAAGIPSAVNAYNKVIDAANAQVLLSTAVTRLREELGTAVKVETGAGDALVAYWNGDKGFKSTLYNDGTNGIKIRYTEETNGAKVPDPVLLIPELKLTNTTKRGGKLYAEYYDEITFKDGVFTVKNLRVRSVDRNGNFSDTNSIIATLVIRPIKQPDLTPIT